MTSRRFRPFIAFAAVIAAAGSVTAAGLTFTAHTVSRSVAELPQVQQRVLPSYVVRLPEAKAADLDIAKSVPVKPRIKVPVSTPAVVAVTQPAPPAATPVQAPAATLTAEVTPLSPDTVEEPVAGGSTYRVRSDVFVRSGPSKSHGRVGTLDGGSTVRVIDEQSGWLKVNYAGRSGWVYERYLAPAPRSEMAEAEAGHAPF